MSKRLYFSIFFVLFCLIGSKAISQSAYLFLNQEFNRSLYKSLYNKNFRFHTSVRPYDFQDVRKVLNYDSIYNLLRMKKKMGEKWKQKAWDKLFNDDVVTLYRKDFSLVINPLMDFSYGYDFIEHKNVWTNTRGIEFKGRIGKNFTFYTNFYENQAVFVNYLNDFVLKTYVVPGQGRIHILIDSTGEHPYLNGKSFDYSSVSGYVSANAGKHFTFQLGHGKNFLGDGYRSLLLSDNSFMNAYFKMEVNFWHMKYLVLYNQYLDLHEEIPEMGYARKYSTIHYLSWSISKRVNLSFFDAIIWQATDTLGNYRGFDWQYLNPIIFLRPVEFSIGSPDNAQLGLNLSVIAGKHNVFYGQLLIDEFHIHEIISGDGFWGNKIGVQAGFKSFNTFNKR